MKEIALYFGSFNPIHIGHMQVAEYVLEKNIAKEVWFVVSPHNPLKDNKELMDEHDRLNMVNQAIENKKNMKAIDVEFSMPKPSYTIDTLTKLSISFLDYKFKIIIGSDNALSFTQWKDYQTILSNYPIIVYPRKNYDIQQIKQKFPQMIIIDAPTIDISSTYIRHFILEPSLVENYLHPSVYKYIIENKLYN